VKILQAGQRGGPTEFLTQEFYALGDNYCSLGQSYSYYETLTDQGLEIARGVLTALRDIVLNGEILSQFGHEPGLQTSLLRFDSAGSALRAAPVLFAPNTIRQTPPSQVVFHTSVGGSDFEFPLSFGDREDIPNRINAVIGYNGTGKTRLLGNLAMVASADQMERQELKFIQQYGRLSDETDSPPRYGAIITISYSAFDTFPLPREPRQVANRDRPSSTGESFGHVYIGLRQRTAEAEQIAVAIGAGDRESEHISILKSSSDLRDDFQRAVDNGMGSPEDRRRALLLQVLTQLRREPSFQRLTLNDFVSNRLDDLTEQFARSSTGHKIVLTILVRLIDHIQTNSLVLIDEPESHLHPPLLATLLRCIGGILREYESYAVVATHSPVVLQEIPARYVRILRRFGERTVVQEPTLETLGDNIGTLTRSIFDLDNSAMDYHSALRALARRGAIEEIETYLGHPLGAQTLAFIMNEQAGLE
jgi:predicted ATPase